MITRWGLHELRFVAQTQLPFEVTMFVMFCQGSSCRHRVRGFFDGDAFAVRFSPPDVGAWTYSTQSDVPSLNGLRGDFRVRHAPLDERGPIRAVDRHFEHADGTVHFSVGTTSYAWAHHSSATRAATLRTLEGPNRAFNKLRFCIFPKWFFYNHEEPQSGMYPYAGAPPAQWDFRTFNVTFWRHLELQIDELRRRGIVAELILFHPYDGVPLKKEPRGRWGFDCMGGQEPASYDTANDEHYLRYAVARLAAFSNVWWSMANEWDLIACKSHGIRSPPPVYLERPSEAELLCYSSQQADVRAAFGNNTGQLWNHWLQFGKAEGRLICDRVRLNGPPTALASPVWDRLFQTLRSEDPYPRETSVHNWNGPSSVLYNHSRPWIDHISLQVFQPVDSLELTSRIVGGMYGQKPVVWDEVGYEGDLPHPWGALSARQMVDRFWQGLSLGVHVGHGETLLTPGLPDDEQVMWWSKGGELRGFSPSRIQWFREHVESRRAHFDFSRLQPWAEADSFGCDCSAMLSPGNFMLVYVMSDRPCSFHLPGASIYRVDAIDYWAMRRRVLAWRAQGVTRVERAALEALNLSGSVPYVVELRSRGIWSDNEV